jgi:hypothetical protein
MSRKHDAKLSEEPLPQDESGAPRVFGGMTVWVFMGERGAYPMAIWSSLDEAHKYIHDELLSGSLTRYEVDVPVYQWAINSGKFKPTKDQHRSLKFRQTFNNQYQEHYNFRDGFCQALGTPRHFEDQQ